MGNWLCHTCFYHAGRFYVFTDGLSESLNDKGEEIGIEGSIKIIENNFNSDLKKQLRDVTTETINTAQNNSLSDDLTLVAIGKWWNRDPEWDSNVFALILYIYNFVLIMKKILLTLMLSLFSTNLFAAQTQIAQVNGMMCIKCQKMVTEALQKASPDAEIKVSWPEGVAVSAFKDKSNLSDEDYEKAILGTGFEVMKVVSVDKIVTDPGEAVKLLD